MSSKRKEILFFTMYKFKINFCDENYINDFNETVRSFYPLATTAEDGDIIELSQDFSNGVLISRLTMFSKNYERRDHVSCVDEIVFKRDKKRSLKLLLYKTLSDFLSKSLPWGSLTGIRPTKLGHDILARGQNPVSVLENDYYVTRERAELVGEILNVQKGIYSTDPLDVDLYINIPFCVSRCSYCSFVSALCDDKKKLLLPYAQTLSKELESAQRIIEDRGLNLRSIYCGGGTPTSFSAELLKIVFSRLSIRGREFTVECGRPDTITKDKLDFLSSIGVTRISINPQTFNQQVLENIGRNHTVQDIYDAYELARRYDFNINMDLIADLPGDTYQSFMDSVSRCVDLNPENVTIHTLSIKHSSKMKDENYDNRILVSDVVNMVSDGRTYLKSNGYKPYYLYRQKNTSGNLENTGYTRENHACIYNVDVMEETTSTISCGAGGISKRVFHDSMRIERQNVVKNIEQYLRDVDEIIIKKIGFFE